MVCHHHNGVTTVRLSHHAGLTRFSTCSKWLRRRGSCTIGANALVLHAPWLGACLASSWCHGRLLPAAIICLTASACREDRCLRLCAAPADDTMEREPTPGR